MNDSGSKTKASCCILTYNSAATLERALNSVKDFEEIIIADGGSVDETLDIARRFGAKIIKQSESPGPIKDYSAVRNKCFDSIATDWFFYIDSDEEATTGLIEEIKEAVKQSPPRFILYKIPAQIVCNGKKIKYSSNYPGYQIRFFNRLSKARFEKPVHERLKFDETEHKVGQFINPWIYFIEGRLDDPNEEYIAREIRRHKGIKELMTGVLNTIKTAVKIFLKSCFIYLRHGFKDSMPVYYEWQRIWYQLRLALAFLKAMAGIVIHEK